MMTKHPLPAWLVVIVFIVAFNGSDCFAQMSTPEKDKEKLQKLVQALGNEQFEVREEAQRRLVVAGEAALDILQIAGKNKDPEICQRASACISQIKQNLYITDMITQLKQGNAKERIDAACILNNLGPKASCAVPALLRAMEDPDTQVRMCAAGAIAQMGHAAKIAVPRLIAVAEDAKEPEVFRRIAVKALGTLGECASESLPCLLRLVKNPNEMLVATAVSALGSVGSNHKDVIPVLLQLLKHEQGIVRGSAAAALGNIGKEPTVVVPALVELMNKEKPIVGKDDPRQSILWGLERFGPHAKPAIQSLFEVIANQNEDLNIRCRAVLVLRAMGQNGKEAVPSLEKLMRSRGDVRLKHNIEIAIDAIENKHK